MGEAYRAAQVTSLVDEHDAFRFTCDSTCWGTCCRTVEIVLYPHDVLRLARRLSKSMTQVLQDHCKAVIMAATGLPRVRLRAAAEDTCEFLLDDGCCSIYVDRPTACRSSPVFPLYQAARNSQVHYFHMLPHRDCQCKNSAPAREWTVREWIESNRLEATWRENEWYARLSDWATSDLEFGTWATSDLMVGLFKTLYTFDQWVPTELDDAEKFRRCDVAARWLLSQAYEIFRGRTQPTMVQADSSGRALRLVKEAQEVLRSGKDT